MQYYNLEIETLDLERLRVLQSASLQKMVQRQYEHVPFYRSKYREMGIEPGDIRGIEDISSLPFTMKDDLRAQYPYGLSAVPEERFARIHASSGTTGKPTVVAYTLYDLDIFDEVVARSLVCAGARPGMKLHNAYGYGLFTGGLGMHGGATKLGMAVIPVSGGMTDRQIMILQDFKPEVLCCTPSYAQTLSEECNHRNIDTEELMVKYAILGAEPWTEVIREQVEAGLNIKATNIYGLSEIIGPGVSQEDVEEQGTGSYIWEDHFYPEVVDQKSGKPLPNGKEGVLVFTTLTKEAMPLTRYWTNDICSIDYDTNGKRTHIKMSAIRGRADDMLIIRGVNVFPTQIEEVLGEIPFLTPAYQILVSRTGTLDEMTLKVEVDGGVDHKSVDLALEVRQKIKDNVGVTSQIELCKGNTIPRSAGGKLKRVIDQREL